MRNNDPIFYPNDEINRSIKQQIDRNYADSITILQTQWAQADIDQRFALGDQELWGVLFPGLTLNNRKMFNFNIINSVLQSISGHQRQTRKSTICIPVLSPMQKTSDQLTKCLYYAHQTSGAYQVYSDSFEMGALTQGLGFISIFLDYASDPSSPDVRTRYIDMKSCIFDPYFRRPDMSDCRFFQTRQFFDKEEVMLLYPKLKNAITNLPTVNYRDDKFYYMPEVYQIQTADLIAIDEYWYLSSRMATYLVDTYTSEAQEFDGNKELLNKTLSNFGERLQVTKRPKQTVRRCILANGRVLADEPNPYGIDRYPIVPVLGYFNPDTSYYGYKFRGVVRDSRDSQFLFNRRKVADLDILESQQQGLKVKKDALVTPKDGLNSGHGRMLVIKKEAQMTDVEQMDIVPPSPVMIQMEEQLMNITYRIIGVDPAAMGIEVDDKAGIISMMRQAATARNLQKLFDNLDEAQKQVGDIFLQIIQKKWSYFKIRNVIGEEPTPEFKDKLFFKYGCKVIQGTLTETQQQLELGQLLHLREITQDPALNEEIVQAMTIQNKDRIIEKLNASAQAQMEQQQKLSEMQLEQMRVDNETKLSYADSQKGLAQERIAKIQTDQAVAYDKIKRAQEEDTASLLNLVKGIKELQGMPTEQLMAKIDMLHRINELDFTDRLGTDIKKETLQKMPQ